MDDLQAVRRLKSGDISGLEFLIARYQARALQTAFLITHHEPMAEDVVQDTFIRFYERIHHFDENRPFEPYFMVSVANAAMNAALRESRNVGFSEKEDETSIETLIARAESVENNVQRTQLKQEIFVMLGKLSVRQRLAVVQRYYFEMSEKEMSEALDVAPGTVKWLLFTARKRLSILLGSERTAE